MADFADVKHDVVVVGSYNHDHVWTSAALPAPGATRLGAYAGGPGGKGFNQAVAAARAGARTAFLAALGDDAAAAHARLLAAAEGIDLQDEVHADLPSGSAGIFVDDAGRNMIVVAPGANGALSTGFVDAHAAALRGARVVLAQLESPGDAILEALTLARAGGALTVLNPAPANADTTIGLLAAADVLTPNETEFAALLARHAHATVDADGLHGLEGAGLHALCQKARSATWVVTLGAHGAFVSHCDGARRGDTQAHYRVEAAPAKAMDTTGAGDAFSGALCAALARAPDAPFADAVRYATRFAALSTERAGAALAMPRDADVRARFAD
jgi:ribokinase